MYKPIDFLIDTKQKKNQTKCTRVCFVQGVDSMLIRNQDGSQTLEVGVGKSDTMTQKTYALLLRKIIHVAKTHNVRNISIIFSDLSFKKIYKNDGILAEIVASNFELANFEFTVYKTPPEEGWKYIEQVHMQGDLSQEIRNGIARGQIIANEVNACRVLANTPGGEITPKLLATAARKAIKGLPIKITVLDEREMGKIGMGGILGVSRGSDEEAQFIILEYKGGSAKEQPVVFVGKGVTFDTGGLNLKPSEAIYEMHMDMSGGAAVLHAVTLAARLGSKKNVIGLIPAVENMPSGSSYRPGDVLRSLSGRTIEVLNTDAEGRIILADGITYAKKYNPRVVVDVATLTGAAVVALGQRCSALFTEDKKIEQQLQTLGEESGDLVWPLPLWEEYEEEIKGTFGDIANVGKTRNGGAITAAIFLHAFAKDLNCPWVHIDIAPRMTSIEGEYLAKGSVGAPVRLLLKIIESSI